MPSYYIPTIIGSCLKEPNQATQATLWYFLIGSGTWTWGSWNQLLLATRVAGTPDQYTTIDSQTDGKVQKTNEKHKTKTMKRKREKGVRE